MNIIEKVREILQNFPKISEIVDEIHADFADPEPTSYGLSSVGDSLIFEDILGNQKRQHNFLFYATYSGINDYERIVNSGVLLELAVWLSKQTGAEVDVTLDNEIYTGRISKITAENGMLIAVPQENPADGMQYQLNITAVYEVYDIEF